MIQQQVASIVQQAMQNGDKKSLALAVDAAQRYYEYLDELEISPLDIDTNISVQVEGKTIRFQNVEEIASWITSNK
jgi:predicted RNA-binding protein Jag